MPRAAVRPIPLHRTVRRVAVLLCLAGVACVMAGTARAGTPLPPAPPEPPVATVASAAPAGTGWTALAAPWLAMLGGLGLLTLRQRSR